MKTAVLTVTYPGVEPYFDEFLGFLAQQTDDDFVLFIVNDGMVSLDSSVNKSHLNIIVVNAQGQPAELRKLGISRIISKGAKEIIFADADDYFSLNRVEILKKYLQNADMVCNELFIFGNNFPNPLALLKNYYRNEERIMIEHIRKSNCCGLTNTATRVDVLEKQILKIPGDCIVFDWAMASLVIGNGAKAIFTDQTGSFYRQHHQNTAGILFHSPEHILRGVEVKRRFYQWLQGIQLGYGYLASEYESLNRSLRTDPKLCQIYCEAVIKQQSNLMQWWESIKLLEELGLCK